jgi:prepilin-type N-terminal cleavage/methylation domain-containing protein
LEDYKFIMKSVKFKKGFTLIELLVVVAIIGILSSVVLASLSSARSKGNDAKVKAQLSNIRVAAELYAEGAGNNSYGTTTTTCTAGMFTDTSSGIAALVNINNYPSGTILDCGASSSAWSVAASLSGGATTSGPAWCVDSTGVSRGNISTGSTYVGVINNAGYSAHPSAGYTSCW